MAAARTRSFIPWLLIAVAALIVYGSLYPFNFKPDAIEGGILQAMRQMSWARAGRGDRISNVLLYLPLGFCLFLWLNSRFHRGASMLLATALGTALSLSVEIAQVYVSSRVSSLMDLSLNCAGTALGATVGLAWSMLNRLLHQPLHAEKPAADPGAAIILFTWLAWRFVPLVPQVDLGKLKAALQPLFDPKFDPATVFIYLTCWLVVSQAVAALASRPRRLEMLLLLIAAVLLGSLLLADQAFVPAELLALLLLLPMLLVTHRLRPQPRRAALVLAVAAVLIIDTLAPFDFSRSMSRFDFWPFMAWFGVDPLLSLQAFDWAALCGKLFLFSALIWAIKEWGTTTRFAAGFVICMVLAIEALQLWLPHQEASIADPLLAAGTGWLMQFFYRRLQPRPFARRAISRDARSR